MSRLDAIKAYKENEDVKKANAEIEKNVQTGDLIRKIQALKPRIDELLDTANACRENGIEIDRYKGSWDRSFDSYEKGTFVTNSITHRVGFANPATDRVYLGYETGFSYLGINNGGACGCWNFRTNGVEVFSVHENNAKRTEAPRVEDMTSFLKKFDEFEAAFYAYVDKVVGRVEPVKPLTYEDFAPVDIDSERLKVLFYNAICCLKEDGYSNTEIESYIGITPAEFDISMSEPGEPVKAMPLDKVLADAKRKKDEMLNGENSSLRNVYVLHCVHESRFGTDSFVSVHYSPEEAEAHVPEVQDEACYEPGGKGEHFSYDIEKKELDVSKMRAIATKRSIDKGTNMQTL